MDLINTTCFSFFASVIAFFYSQKTNNSSSLWLSPSDLSFEPPHDKTNKTSVRPAKTKISLGICRVWSESSLCAQLVAEDPSFLQADSEDWSDYTHVPFCWFCRAAAHLIYNCRLNHQKANSQQSIARKNSSDGKIEYIMASMLIVLHDMW